MDTIIQKNAVHPIIYHGLITFRCGDAFIFETRSNCKNIVFEGNLDYWRIVEGLE